MLSGPFSAFVNHLLNAAEWARTSLAEHAGKIAILELFPARIALAVQADGTLQPATADAVPALTIRLTHATALHILLEGEPAWRQANVDGDTAFASAIARVAANLRWDAEEDLSKIFGDIAAHRMAGAARTAKQWPQQAAASIAGNLAEFLTEEKHILVTPLRAADFLRDVDELRDSVERLDKRVERLRRAQRGN